MASPDREKPLTPEEEIRKSFHRRGLAAGHFQGPRGLPILEERSAAIGDDSHRGAFIDGAAEGVARTRKQLPYDAAIPKAVLEDFTTDMITIATYLHTQAQRIRDLQRVRPTT